MKNLKFLAVFGLFAFILAGCAPSQSVVALDPYKATSTTVNKSGLEVYISNVHDNRKNKSTVATITDGKGSVKEYVMLQNDLAGWFKEALTTQLVSNGVNVGSMGGLVVEVFINEFDANMSGYKSDNTRGNIKITLKITKGDQNIVKNISNNQTKFELIRTGSAFKPFLKDMIDDAVKRTAAAIINS